MPTLLTAPTVRAGYPKGGPCPPSAGSTIVAKSKAYARIKADVLGVVADVPAGRVTTYGAIAAALDVGPRRVAYVLANEPEAAEVPWHRVVAAGGRLSIPRSDASAEQARRLREEGVGIADGKVLGFAAVFHSP